MAMLLLRSCSRIVPFCTRHIRAVSCISGQRNHLGPGTDNHPPLILMLQELLLDETHSIVDQLCDLQAFVRTSCGITLWHLPLNISFVCTTASRAVNQTSRCSTDNLPLFIQCVEIQGERMHNICRLPESESALTTRPSILQAPYSFLALTEDRR